MSRLNGRVVFPGSAGNSQSTSNDVRREISPGAQENFKPAGGEPRRRGRGFNQNNQVPEKFERQEWSRRDERQERGQPVQQQKYDRPARFEQNDRNDRVERSQRNQRNERPQQPRQNQQPYKPYKPERSNQEPAENETSRKPTPRVEHVAKIEELLEVEDIITQISDLSVRSDRSAAQIKRNILGSTDLLDTMSEDDWEMVCKSMVATAFEQDEPDFIADIILALFQNQIFPHIMSDVLYESSSSYIIEQDGNPIPAFLAAILCAHWPAKFAKAFDNVNPVLFMVVSIVKGWILVVSEDTERYYKKEEKPKYQVREEDREDENKEEKKEEEKIIESPELVNQCALALSELCDTAQRQLWVNWMDLTDEIYQCIKPAITHNPNLTGDVKDRLLDTFVQMNYWTKTKKVSTKHAKVQTVSTSSQ